MLGLRQATRQARGRTAIGPGSDDSPSSADRLRQPPGPAEAFLGEPRSTGKIPRQRNAAFSTRGLRESASTAALRCRLEEEDDLALADENVVSLEPQALNPKGGPSSTSRQAAQRCRAVGTTTAAGPAPFRPEPRDDR
jgi:hypothetical protein